jgi:hypothetical protein
VEVISDGKSLERLRIGNVWYLNSLLSGYPSPTNLKERNVGSLQGEERKKVIGVGLQG